MTTMDLFDYLHRCGECHRELSGSEKDEGACLACGYRFDPLQRTWALAAPNVYGAEVILPDGGRGLLLQLAERTVKGKVLRHFGQFVITTHGIECLSRDYPIDATRLDEKNWEDHMATKPWADLADFRDALQYARGEQRFAAQAPTN